MGGNGGYAHACLWNTRGLLQQIPKSRRRHARQGTTSRISTFNPARETVVGASLCRLVAGLAMLSFAQPALDADEPGGRWSVDRANRWYESQPWPVGCDFIPSSAINQIETWQAESFDPKTIDRELGWAEDLGFNTIRVFLHDLVWEADPAAFKKRFGEFLDICQKHHIRVIVTFFTNGCYGYEGEPRLGRQPDPAPGVHNSGWVQSPGAAIVNDPSRWGRLEEYVKDVVGTFARDGRVAMWSLYNEPENTKKGARSLPLLREVFRWARTVNPSQPLTSPIWRIPTPRSTSLDIARFLEDHCDVLSFHCYGDPSEMQAFIEWLKSSGRPLVCTEYMARPKSTFEEILPILKSEHVGAISFGLVAGKMNTYYPWGSKPGSPEPKVWHHDVLRRDGTPFDAQGDGVDPSTYWSRVSAGESTVRQ